MGRGVEVVARDSAGLVALAKPAGVLSHPNERGEEDRSLLQASYHLDGEYYRWTSPQGEETRVWLLNRLDSATSGVLIVARSEGLARAIRALFQQRQIHKVYHALVFGGSPVGAQVWRDLLAVDKRGGRIRTGTVGNIPAETAMRVVEQRRGTFSLSLLELLPKTGRSHQLRVQCAKRHLPIVGDATYGDFAANRTFAKATGEKRLFLHSSETRFSYEWQGRKFAFHAVAPLPAAFREALQGR